METVAELQRKLTAAKERERLASIQCSSCSGKGWYSDTTYDRCGVNVRCGRCHGTGLPQERVDDLIAEALKPLVKAVPD